MASDRVRTPENDLDTIRRLILGTIRDRTGISVASVSRYVSPSGRGSSYLSDWIFYSEKPLTEPVRYKLAAHLGLSEADLRHPGVLKEHPASYEQPPPTSTAEEPLAPYEARDLMGDLYEALDRLHREERLALSLGELGLAAWDMHQEIMAATGDLRAGLDAALRARRRWLRQRRADILAQRKLAS